MPSAAFASHGFRIAERPSSRFLEERINVARDLDVITPRVVFRGTARERKKIIRCFLFSVTRDLADTITVTSEQ